MFSETLTKFNLGEDIAVMGESYSYSDFVNDMYDIGRTIQETVNEYCKLMNESAVMSICEGTELTTVDNSASKKAFIDKLKDLWDKIVENAIKAFNNIYNWIIKQVKYHQAFIKMHKDDIMKTNLVYEKGANYDATMKKETKVGKVTIDGETVIKSAARTLVDSIKSYKNILNPSLNIPVLIGDDLKDFITDSGRVDKAKLNAKYKELILGSTEKNTDIDIDDINSHKAALLKGVDKTFEIVKVNQNKITKSNQLRRRVPDNITSEKVDQFKLEMLNEVDSLKEYNKVLLEYCNVNSSILRMFIKKEIDAKKEV